MACEKYKSYQKPENLKHKLHFTGSSTVSYDGSNDVTVNIPSSGDATNGSLLIKADNNDYVSFDGGENRSVNLRSGNNVRIDKATTGGESLDLTFNATDTTYDIATPSTNGLMSAEDKNKLDGIESGDATNYSLLIVADNTDSISFNGGKNKSVEFRSGSNVRIDKATTSDGETMVLTFNASVTNSDVTNALGFTPTRIYNGTSETPPTSGLQVGDIYIQLES